MVKSYARGNKLWIEYTINYVRYRKSTGLNNSMKNRRIVKKEIIPEIELKIASGEIYRVKSKTFRHYANIFLEHKESTIRSFEHRLPFYKRVINYFGKKDIDTISRLDIKIYLNTLKMKSKSKGVYKSCIAEIFELASDDGIITYNPALNIRLPRDQKPQVQYYEREDVLKLIRSASGIMRAYLTIAYNTGLRPEEILGLKRSDINDETISITRVRTKGRIDIPKTSNGYRQVPVTKSILKEIKELDSSSEFLFGNIDDVGKMQKYWKKVVKSSGVEHKKLSCSRHTFATLMLKEKIVSINELSGLLGHSSPKVTLAYYTSVIELKRITLGENFSLFDTVFDTV